jgi:hypothetical protein
LTCDGVAAGLRELGGNMAAVARKYGVGRTAVFMFVERHPSLKEVVKECRESMKDDAESSLQRALLAGEPWAVCFFLKCQAKDRGYVERQEVTGKDGEELAAVDAIVTALLKAKREQAGTTNGTSHRD